MGGVFRKENLPGLLHKNASQPPLDGVQNKERAHHECRRENTERNGLVIPLEKGIQIFEFQRPAQYQHLVPGGA